jgi:L1 cell adhesion molecule like protein
VSAPEKGTRKIKTIAITKNKGCLSKEKIERMVARAKKYKTKDKVEAARISARNNLNVCTEIDKTGRR